MTLQDLRDQSAGLPGDTIVTSLPVGAEPIEAFDFSYQQAVEYMDTQGEMQKGNIIVVM